MEKSEYFEETKECLQHQEFDELRNTMNNLWKLSFNETTLYFDGRDSFWEAISSRTTNDLKDTLQWIDNFRIKLEGKNRSKENEGIMNRKNKLPSEEELELQISQNFDDLMTNIDEEALINKMEETLWLHSEKNFYDQIEGMLNVFATFNSIFIQNIFKYNDQKYELFHI